MRRRAFTLIELATVMSILAIVVPSTFLFVRTVTARHDVAIDRLSAARAMRTIAEELRKDLKTGHFEAGEVLSIAGAAPCVLITYKVQAGVVTRDGGDGCGGKRALASHVLELARASDDSVKVVFGSVDATSRARESATFVLASAPAAAPKETR